MGDAQIHARGGALGIAAELAPKAACTHRERRQLFPRAAVRGDARARVGNPEIRPGRRSCWPADAAGPGSPVPEGRRKPLRLRLTPCASAGATVAGMIPLDLL